ncbi:transmembrane protein 231-like [Oscarella lobularis]|uniref:transmembrane protein 231-like n=1 Tax=Oscarella lobularis TaxID=121494 RepID=UPI003313A65B
MALFSVYSSPIARLYRASVFSKAFLFQLVIFLATIIVPFFVSYRSLGFWLRVSTFREQPDIKYRHEAMIFARGPNRLLAWSTFSHFNLIYSNHLRIPVIKSYEEDDNHDGLNDRLILTVEMPRLEEETIVDIQMLLFFSYSLKRYVDLKLQGMAFIHDSTPIPGSRFDFSGQLEFKQATPLSLTTHYTQYDVSVVNSSSPFAIDYDVVDILRMYESRNESIYLSNVNRIWRNDYSSSSEKFTLSGVIRYPNQVISYRPNFWQIIKEAWIQYLAILVVFIFVFHYLKRFVFENQIVQTIVK